MTASKGMKFYFFRFFCFSALLIIFAYSSGCAPRVKLRDEVRNSLKRITISDEVKISERSFLMDTHMSSFEGVLLKMLFEKGRKKALQVAELARNEIPVIVKEEFAVALKKSNLFEIVENGADNSARVNAILVLAVDDYGFSQPVGLVDGRRPALCVTGRLILNPPFRAVWTRTDRWEIMIENPDAHPVAWTDFFCEWGQIADIPAYSVDAYVEDPAKLRDGFTLAARSIAERLIGDMKE